MPLRKLYPFVLVATLAGFATVGTLNVEIKEYDVPTPRSRPHDPALAPDGSLWYTGQGANKLGRLDPKTGEFKEYPLKTRDSGPHGLVADKDGNIWFTAISGGYANRHLQEPSSTDVPTTRGSCAIFCWIEGVIYVMDRGVPQRARSLANVDRDMRRSRLLLPHQGRNAI